MSSIIIDLFAAGAVVIHKSLFVEMKQKIGYFIQKEVINFLLFIFKMAFKTFNNNTFTQMIPFYCSTKKKE